MVYDDSLYLYGGCEGGGSDDELYFADLNQFDISTKKWSNIRVAGNVPSGRDNHACGVLEDLMLVYGGNTAAGLSDEIFTLSFDGFIWNKQEPLGLNPGRRESAGYTVIGTCMYLFGGNINGDRRRGDTCSDDFFTLSLIHGDIVCERVHVLGPLPPGRVSHTLTAVSDHTLALYGGEKDGTMLQDIWLYYVDCCCWLQVQAQIPLPVRMAHSAVAYNGKLLLFGGMGSDSVSRSELCVITFHNNPFIPPHDSNSDVHVSTRVSDVCVKCRHRVSTCELEEAYQGFKFPNFNYCSRALAPTQAVQEAADSLNDPYLSILHILYDFGPGSFQVNFSNTKPGDMSNIAESSDSSSSTLDLPAGKVLLVQSNVGLKPELAVGYMTGKWLPWIATVGNAAILLTRDEGVLSVVAVQIGDELAASYKLVYDKEGSCIYPEYSLYHKTLDIIAKLSGLQPSRILSHSSGSILHFHTRSFQERSKSILCPASHQSLSLNEFLQYAWHHAPYPQNYTVSGVAVTPMTISGSAIKESNNHYERWVWRCSGPSSITVYHENRLLYLWREEGKKRSEGGTCLVISLSSRKYLLKNEVRTRQTLCMEQAWELLTF